MSLLRRDDDDLQKASRSSSILLDYAASTHALLWSEIKSTPDDANDLTSSHFSMDDTELDLVLARNPALRQAVEKRIELAIRAEIQRLADAAFAEVSRAVPELQHGAYHNTLYARMSRRALSWFEQASDKRRCSYLQALQSLYHSGTCTKGESCNLFKPCLVTICLLTCLDHVMSCSGCDVKGCRALADKLLHMIHCDKALCDTCINVFELLQLHSDTCKSHSCKHFLCEAFKRQSDTAPVRVAMISALLRSNGHVAS